jgi:uncharacterized membrane protein
VLLLGCALLAALAGVAPAHERHPEPPREPSAQAAPEAREGERTEPSPPESRERPAYPPEGVPRAIAWLGKLHPASVDLPIALLLAGAAAELLLIRTGRALFQHAARFCVWGGSLGAALAAPLGWIFATSYGADQEWILNVHRWLGTATAAFSLVLPLLCERSQRRGERTAFRLALFPAALLVASTAFFGGALVWGLDHYAW